MGHETVGRIDGEGTLVTVNPVIGRGDCPQCAAGTEQVCGGGPIGRACALAAGSLDASKVLVYRADA